MHFFRFSHLHGAAAVYVSIGRLHSLSVFYRASHNTPATPPPPTPRPPEGPQRQKRTPRETPPHADHKTAPTPTPKRTPERATPQSPGPHQKKCGATPSKIHQGTKARTAPRPTRKEAPHIAHPRHPRPPGSRETNRSKPAQVPRDTLQICILFDQVNIFGLG